MERVGGEGRGEVVKSLHSNQINTSLTEAEPLYPWLDPALSVTYH